MIRKSNTANIRNLLTPMLTISDIIDCGESIDSEVINMLSKQINTNVYRILDELKEIDSASEILTQTESLYCTECNSLCYPYDQGTACNCDQPWLTEVIHESEFPAKWIKVTVDVRKQ